MNEPNTYGDQERAAVYRAGLRSARRSERLIDERRFPDDLLRSLFSLLRRSAPSVGLMQPFVLSLFAISQSAQRSMAFFEMPMPKRWRCIQVSSATDMRL